MGNPMKLIPVLDDLDRNILKHLMEGYTPKEISGKVWKSKSVIHTRLHRLRKFYKVGTTIQLICVLNKES